MFGVREVGVVGRRAELIKLGRENRAHQVLQVVTVLTEVRRQRVEERLIHGRIGGAEIVHRLDHAAPEERRPDAVDRALCEKRIVGVGQPIGQRQPGIAIVRRGEFGGIGRPGFHHRVRQRMPDIATGREVKHLGARRNGWRQPGALLLHRTEERRELVEVVLAPFLVRMMMALGALQPHPEKQLAEHRRQLRRLASVTIHHGWTIVMVAPFGRDDGARELIEGQILAEGFPQPLIEQIDALHPDAVGIRPQQVGPLVGPVIRPRGVLHQLLDPFPALVGRGVGNKDARLLRRGQHADRIQCGAADELLVGAAGGRIKSQLLKMCVGAFVDEVGHGKLAVTLGRQDAIGRHGQVRRVHEAHEARDNDALAAQLTNLNLPSFIDRREFLVLRDKLRQARDVAGRVV